MSRPLIAGRVSLGYSEQHYPHPEELRSVSIKARLTTRLELNARTERIC